MERLQSRVASPRSTERRFRWERTRLAMPQVARSSGPRFLAELATTGVAAAETPAAGVSVVIPGIMGRTVIAEIRIGSPTENPGRHQPGPAEGRIVNVLIRLRAVLRIRVLRSIRHPDPTVLLGVDPLSAGFVAL